MHVDVCMRREVRNFTQWPECALISWSHLQTAYVLDRKGLVLVLEDLSAGCVHRKAYVTRRSWAARRELD